MSSLTVENYAKCIYLLCAGQAGQPAATGQIAEALEVSPGTVTSMLKSLSDAGLGDYTPYEGVRLTDAGRRLALRVIRRHRLIELFLERTLDMNWSEVHAEAEHLEHAVSDRLINRIDEFLGFPEFDPHGDPIPKEDGRVASTTGTTLDHWPSARPFRLVRVVDQSPEFLRDLTESGLTLGVVGTVLAPTTTTGIIMLRIDDLTRAVSREAAAKVIVAEAETPA